MKPTESGSSAYAELGVPVGSALDVARRAWRTAALATHPDRGGDPVAFNRKRLAWRKVRGLASSGPHLVVVPDPPRPWTRARAINRAVELDLQVEDMGDDTGVTADGDEVVWFSDAGVEIEGELWTWAELDDDLMADVFDLAGAVQGPLA